MERLAQALNDAAGDTHEGKFIRVIVQQDQKLVAAPPRQQVAFAYIPFYAPADLGQQQVACFVPKSVVDPFEPIQIKKYERDIARRAPGASQLNTQVFREKLPVGQPCQAVDISQTLHRFSLIEQLPGLLAVLVRFGIDGGHHTVDVVTQCRHFIAPFNIDSQAVVFSFFNPARKLRQARQR